MEKQQGKLTMEHLSALYWLKVLDEFDGGEDMLTLIEKYQGVFTNKSKDCQEDKKRGQS